MADFIRNLTIILLVAALWLAAPKEESAASDAAVATESAALDSKAIHTNAAKTQNNWSVPAKRPRAKPSTGQKCSTAI